MKLNLVLLAKSKKGPDGYCIAGIDINSGEWVRLNAPGFYSIPRELFKYSSGQEPELLDAFSVEIIGKDNRERLQPENYLIELNSIEPLPDNAVNTVNDRLLKDKSYQYIFYDDDRVVDADGLRTNDVDLYSLMIIEPENLRFYKGDSGKITAYFTYNGTEYRGLRVTDLGFMELWNQSGLRTFYKPKSQYLLVISLGQPYAREDDSKERCWKLIASVIEKKNLSIVFNNGDANHADICKEEQPKEKILESLKALRSELAKRDRIPAYCVFHDKVLDAIAEIKPRSMSELIQIKGVGPQNSEKYGEAVLDVLAKYVESSGGGNTIHKSEDEEPENDFTPEQTVSGKGGMDYSLLLKMIRAVADGIDPDTGETLDTESIINDAEFKNAIKRISKRYTSKKAVVERSTSDTYTMFEERYPGSIVIRKEGAFYTARNDSAIRLHEAIGYRLNKDKGGRYITGGPSIQKITDELKEQRVNYIVIEGDTVTDEYEYDDNNELKHTSASDLVDTAVEHKHKAEKEKNQYIKNAKEPETARSCNNCKLYRIGDCGGIGGLCEFYQYAPTTSEEELESWPTDMGPYVTGYGNKHRR